MVIKPILWCISPASLIKISPSVEELHSNIQLCINFAHAPNSGHFFITPDTALTKLISNFNHHHVKRASIAHLILDFESHGTFRCRVMNFKSRCIYANIYATSMKLALTKSSIASVWLIVCKRNLVQWYVIVVPLHCMKISQIAF